MEIQCVNPCCSHSPLSKNDLKLHGKLRNLFYHKDSMIYSDGEVVMEVMNLGLSSEINNKYFCVGCGKESQLK